MPPKAKDLTGMKFGRLTVIKRAANSWDGKPMWECSCECGNNCVIYGSALTSGNTKSCGCYRKELPKKTKYVHGGERRAGHDRLYGVWNMMKQRCYCKTNRSYNNYGGRGIEVCDEWRYSYAAFRLWALANGYNDNAESRKCTIDRIDNNGNYCPDNCRWVDARQQANNTRNNHFLTFNGETLSVAEWARKTGINRATILNRISRGWTIEDTLTYKVKRGANQYGEHYRNNHS